MIPNQVTLLWHGGCSRGHWTMSEMRKCAGRYVHADEIRTVTFVVPKAVGLIHEELDQWLNESENKLLRSPLGYHHAYLQKIRAQLARLLGAKPRETDANAEEFIRKARARADSERTSGAGSRS